MEVSKQMSLFTLDRLNDNREIKILSCSETQISERKENPCFLLGIVSDGFATIKINEENYVISAPAFLCLNSSQMFSIEEKKNYKARYLLFDPTFLNQNLTEERMSDDGYKDLCDQHDFFRLEPFLSQDFGESYVTGLSPELLIRVLSLFDECESKLKNQPHWYWSCLTRSSFMDILHIVERIFYNKSAAGHSVFDSLVIPEGYEDISNAVFLIWTRYSDELLKAAVIANEVGDDARTLGRRFKKASGITVSEYITSYRLYIAGYKLRFTQLPIQEIAESSGFKSSAYFCKVFKNKHGLTPTKFRSQVVNKRKDAFE